MGKLPHFTNIIAAQNTVDAIYPALFEITFILPKPLQDQGRDPAVFLESANNVTLELQPDLPIAEQRYKYSTRAYVTLPEKTHVEYSIAFNMNVDKTGAMYVWNILRAWYNIAWNSATGEVGYKGDMTGTMIVNQHDKKGFILRRVTFNNVQIKHIDGYELDWSKTSEILEPLKADFVADYWIDEYIDNGFQFNPPNIYIS